VLGQAGLQNALDELQRGEDQEIMTINAEIDAGDPQTAISRSSAPRRSPSSRTSAPRACC
jgi:hypothetical protein